MPAQTSLVINDGQATPVAHTFTPNGAMLTPEKKVLAEWVDRSPANKAGYWTLAEQHSPTNSNGIEKMRFVIDRPTVESVVGAAGTGYQAPPKRAYAGMVVVEVWSHERATPAELADLAALARNFTANAFFTGKVTSRERTW